MALHGGRSLKAHQRLLLARAFDSLLQARRISLLQARASCADKAIQPAID